MKYHQIILQGMLTFLIAVMMPASSKARDNAAVHPSLARDIRIMEGVIDKLLSPDQTLSSGVSTRGMFIPGYGLLFRKILSRPVKNVAYTELFKGFSEMRQNRLLPDMPGIPDTMMLSLDSLNILSRSGNRHGANIRLPVIRMETSRKEILEEENRAFQELRDNITTFFRDYARAIGHLDPGDRITVLVELENWERAREEGSFLSAWAPYSSLRSTGNRNSVPVQFETSPGNPEIRRDIDIMSEIMDRAMALSMPDRNTSTEGVYLEGLGALFFVTLSGQWSFAGDGRNAFSVLVTPDTNQAFSYRFHTSGGRDGGNTFMSDESLRKKITDELSDLLLSYGHTLRIEPSESALVHISRTGSFFVRVDGNKKPDDHILIQLKKADLDAFYEGRKTEDAVRSDLQISTY